MRTILTILCLLIAGTGFAQHEHDLHGVPDFSMGGQPSLIGAGPDSIVHLPAGSDETIDQPTEVLAIGVHGTLTISSELRVKDLLVYPNGTLRLLPGARIVIRDIPCDLNTDPEQWGTGINVFGALDAIGTEKLPYLRTQISLRAGDNLAPIDAMPVGWEPGDWLVICDTQQRAYGEPYVDRNELVMLSSISPDGYIRFVPPLKYDHPRLVDNPWGISRYAPIGNLTRDVVIESENPSGTRGHVAFHHAADVTTYFVQFRDLGRTRAEPLGPSNPAGRYPWHAHHFTGNVDAYGCAVDTFLRWGMVLHDCQHQLLDSNVVYGGKGNRNGAGIVTEQGTERYNVITRNLACGITGSVEQPNVPNPLGHNSDGFWFNAAGNYVDGNLSFGNRGNGFAFNGYGRDLQAHKSRFTVHPDTPFLAPILSFENNEAAANDLALWCSLSQGQISGTFAGWQRHNLGNLLGWHNRSGIEVYHEGPTIYSDFTVVFDPAVARRNLGARNYIHLNRSIGFNLRQYELLKWQFVRPRVYGGQIGFLLGTNPGDYMIIDSPDLVNHCNIAALHRSNWSKTIFRNPPQEPRFSNVGPGKDNNVLPATTVDVYVK